MKAETFASRLKKRMREKGMTQVALADLLEVSQPCVHRWLQGTNEPKWRYREKLMELVFDEPPTSANLFRAARKAVKLTQAEMAGRLDVTRTYLNEIERGRKRPSAKVARRMDAFIHPPVAQVNCITEEVRRIEASLEAIKKALGIQ